MKQLIIIALILTSGYLGYQLHDTKAQLAASNGELDKAREELAALALPAEKTWLQQKILGRNQSLEAGAYDQKQGVSRGASIYYAPRNNVNVQVAATPPPASRRQQKSYQSQP